MSQMIQKNVRKKSTRFNLYTKVSIAVALFAIIINCSCDIYAQPSQPTEDMILCQEIGEGVPKTLADTILLSNNMSHLRLLYWNIFTRKHDEYLFSYSQNTQKLTLTAPYPEDAPVLEIETDSTIRLFVNIINRFYILKTDKIVEKRVPKDDIIVTDYETLSLNLYTHDGKRQFVSTNLEEEDNELIFNPDFEVFVELLNDLIVRYDQLSDFDKESAPWVPPLMDVEEAPEFPGGADSLAAFLQREIQYPAVAMENGITGAVLVEFVVEKDGRVSNAKVKVPLFPECDMEAVRGVLSMPRWKPGRNQGEPVRCYYQLPIYFR